MDAQGRFDALYRAHNEAILRYARRRTDQDTARDVVAETFLIAWRRLADVPAGPGQAEPWLYGVARPGAGECRAVPAPDAAGHCAALAAGPGRRGA